MLVSETPGEECRFRFEGTAVGIFVAAGPDAGILEFRIDGAPWRSQKLFTNWSKSLHIPWAYVLDSDLAPARHELAMRVSSGAVRVAHLLVTKCNGVYPPVHRNFSCRRSPRPRPESGR